MASYNWKGDKYTPRLTSNKQGRARRFNFAVFTVRGMLKRLDYMEQDLESEIGSNLDLDYIKVRHALEDLEIGIKARHEGIIEQEKAIKQ